MTKFEDLLPKFEDVRPTLLLFLQKIRSINVIIHRNKDRVTVRQMRRSHIGRNIVDLSDGIDRKERSRFVIVFVSANLLNFFEFNFTYTLICFLGFFLYTDIILSSTRYFVVTSLINVPAGLREDFSETKIVLAFPIHQDLTSSIPCDRDRSVPEFAEIGNKLTTSRDPISLEYLAGLMEQVNNVNLSTVNVFAFLPVMEYGFKFVIQGDFILPASRGLKLSIFIGIIVNLYFFNFRANRQ